MRFPTAARVSTLLLAIIPTSSASVVPAPPRALKPITGDACALGFDFGTSGVRCAVVDAAGGIVASPAGYSWGDKERNQSADDWKAALFSQLGDIPLAARQRIERIAVSGTSGSILLVEEDGTPSRTRGNPRMYDFSVKKQAGEAGAAALKLLEESTPEPVTLRRVKIPARVRASRASSSSYCPCQFSRIAWPCCSNCESAACETCD